MGRVDPISGFWTHIENHNHSFCVSGVDHQKLIVTIIINYEVTESMIKARVITMVSVSIITKHRICQLW